MDDGDGDVCLVSYIDAPSVMIIMLPVAGIPTVKTGLFRGTIRDAAALTFVPDALSMCIIASLLCTGDDSKASLRVGCVSSSSISDVVSRLVSSDGVHVSELEGYKTMSIGHTSSPDYLPLIFDSKTIALFSFASGKMSLVQVMVMDTAITLCRVYQDILILCFEGRASIRT